ncbi:ABC transporter substrate-binding protein [Curvibacter sp. CHRR-16]|uniref:ABC transporter substrate-binding protein n=1 Tax=Curvibacter sp. CHRR-16 TaxID=2835872 RepID=UPI001BD9291C|nr:ABC transporter substrate-binding protein [Curvibacter sp. CHRR-16]MBT0571650.1 ABC transporter substrate-binding protein [Curvibacter sp. CHRR-16]
MQSNRRQVLQWLGATGFALPWASRASGGRIVLGQSAAMSGPSAQLGIQMALGAKACFDAFNAAGGINGTTIELRTLDDGYDPERCKANTAKFIADDVFALFGYVGTPTTVAALPLIKDSRKPFLGPFTGAMSLREPRLKNVFHVRASYDQETEEIIKQLTNLGLKRIAVFMQNDAYGEAGLSGVTKALQARGLAPVGIGRVERNSLDVAAAVKDVLASKPDAVVQVSVYKACAEFIRAARKGGYGGVFFNISFVGTQALADELGSEGAGVRVTQVMPYPYAPILPIVKEYQDALRKYAGDAKPNYSSMEGYIAARVLIEGLKLAKPLSPEGLIAGLESLNNISVGGFAVGFSSSNHVASKFVELSMLSGDGRVRR